MKLLKYPRSPLLVTITALILAVIAALVIVQLVFTFGYYASGLAAEKELERRRRAQPISVEFSKPAGDDGSAAATGEAAGSGAAGGPGESGEPDAGVPAGESGPAPERDGDG